MEEHWPEKTSEIHNHHMDSTRWNEFVPRGDDIIVATYGKSGTTWLQQILGQLIHNGDTSVNIADESPWLDMRVIPLQVLLTKLENQSHRRFIKTHLPVHALRFFPQCKYIYIARDGRDVLWSLYNHHANANEGWYDAVNKTPGLVGPPIDPPKEDIVEYWKDWMDGDGFPFWSFWENVRSWWEIRNLPNVLLLHFLDLKKDLPDSIRKIAKFIDHTIDESKFPEIVEHCSFTWMKEHGSLVVPANGSFFKGGTKTFINKGTNGRWVDILPQSEKERYESMAREKLGEECANWLNQH